MKSKIANLCLIIFFFAVSAFFLAASVFGLGAGSAREIKSAAPSVLAPEGGLNTAYTGQFTDYFSANYAFKSVMVDAYSRLVTKTLMTSPVENVILGRGGWLFYSETLDDYLGAAPMSERAVSAAARSLSLMSEYAEENGARLLFVPAPNKNTLYPEKMPYAGSGGPTNLDRLLSRLDGQGVEYLDLREVLTSDEPLYYKNDSHWNALGAAMTADAVYGALGADSGFAQNMTQTAAENGDLFEMLYPASETTEPDYEYAPGFGFDYSPAFRTPEDITIETKNEAAEGSLLVFRDSFGNLLHSFLAEGSGSALFSRSNSYRLDFIARTGANAVVIELVERNLGYLTVYAPVFPAPERDIAVPALYLQDFSGVEVSVERSGELPGYIKITGNVAAYDGMPDDMPIYLICGDKIYEMTPSGQYPGEAPFTAYLPEDADLDMVSVILVKYGAAFVADVVLVLK